jgi:hypothetical protein
MPPQQPAGCDETRASRNALLSAARLLVGHGGAYVGHVVVRIAAPELGVELKVTPTADCHGLPTAGQSLQLAGVGNSANIQEMLAAMFSRDEVRILSELLGGAVCKASNVLSATKIEKSKFWALWSNLQQRGVVVDAEGDDGGFVLGPEWVREFLEARNANG